MKRVPSVVFLAALALPVVAAAQITYPETRKVDQADVYHGTTIRDVYRWLEDPDSPETRAWVEAQNKVTFGYLAQIPEREEIRLRLTKAWNYPKYGTPWREGNHLFWFENTGLQNQSVLYVRHPETERMKSATHVLIDPNTLSPDGTVALNVTAVSPDGQLIAYGVSSSGSDWQEFRVRNVTTTKDLPDTIRWAKFSGVSWTKDGKGFFYSRYPTPEGGNQYVSVVKNQKLYYHRLGTPQSQDVLIYERPDQPDWGLGGDVSDDGRILWITPWQGTDERNRLYYVDLGDPKQPRINGPVVRLIDTLEAAYAPVGNDGRTVYIQTNRDAPRTRLVAIELDRPAPTEWRTIIPEHPKDALIATFLYGGRFVAEYLSDAKSAVRFVGKDGKPLGELTLPTLGTVGAITGKVNESHIYYSFASFLYPTTIFHHDLTTGRTTTHRAPKIAVDVSRYETKQVFYTSRDGTRIPMFITMRKGTKLDGSNPTFLYAYGGFNIPMTPSFSARNLVWLELGGIYAMPNLRGGGEYGREWHEAGMFERKQNVFDDFIAAAEYLVNEKYTSPQKLAISGGSNGGLLIGAVLNQRPDLFGVALPAVGVMDMLRYHRFTIGYAWASEYGSADSANAFPYLLKYSPIHNIRPGTRYPATLVTTADHDDRVVPAHSFKYAATLQAAQAGPDPILIRIETKAGHGAGKPTSKAIDEAADILSFVVKNLEMQIPTSKPVSE